MNYVGGNLLYHHRFCGLDSSWHDAMVYKMVQATLSRGYLLIERAGLLLSDSFALFRMWRIFNRRKGKTEQSSPSSMQISTCWYLDEKRSASMFWAMRRIQIRNTHSKLTSSLPEEPLDWFVKQIWRILRWRNFFQWQTDVTKRSANAVRTGIKIWCTPDYNKIIHAPLMDGSNGESENDGVAQTAFYLHCYPWDGISRNSYMHLPVVHSNPFAQINKEDNKHDNHAIIHGPEFTFEKQPSKRLKEYDTKASIIVPRGQTRSNDSHPTQKDTRAN